MEQPPSVSDNTSRFPEFVKEPRFNLMYDKFRFYQRKKFKLDLSLAKWRYFFLLWAGFFFFFSLPKDFLGILSST